jgi:hypothetical protein
MEPDKLSRGLACFALPPSDIRNPRRRPSLSFFKMATIRSQRQAAAPSYLRIAKRAATL